MDILPLLNPPTWPGRREYVHWPLVPDADVAVPLVAYGTAGVGEFHYVTWRALHSSGLHPEKVEAIGRQNLRARRGGSKWGIEVDAGRDLTYLVRRGNDLTASEILDPDALRWAQEYWGTTEICVAVPSRRVLLAFAPVDLAVMSEVVRREHARAKAAGFRTVSPLVFSAKDGALVGVASPVRVAAARTAEPPEEVLEGVPCDATAFDEKFVPPPAVEAPAPARTHRRRRRMAGSTPVWIGVGAIAAFGLLAVAGLFLRDSVRNREFRQRRAELRAKAEEKFARGGPEPEFAAFLVAHFHEPSASFARSPDGYSEEKYLERMGELLRAEMARPNSPLRERWRRERER